MGKDLKGRELGKCLSQRKDGRYQARFTNRYGQRIEYKDKNLNNVKEWIKKEKAKDDLGINSKQNNDTLDMWYLRWKEMAFVDLSEGSTQLYESIYKNQIYPKLGNIKIKDITEFMLRKFFQEQKNYYADSTINGIKNILNQIMQCCKDAKCILYNPVKELKIKKRRKNKNALNVDSKAISIEDEKDLFIYLKGHFYYNMFLFYLTTGLRYGDDDDKIRLNQRKPSKYKGLSRFGPEKNLQRINKFMKERPTFYKKLIQMKENFRFYLRCFYCITKVVILQFNSEKQDRISS